MKIIIALMILMILSGCAGIGLNKKCTMVPDEIWITGDTNFEEEDSSKIVGGLKWKLE